MNRTLKMPLLLAGLALLVSGCGMTRAAQRPPSPVGVIKAASPEALSPKKGSIWQSSDRNTLFLDDKARNIGDLVTVRIAEQASAKKNAKTELLRESESKVDMGGMFGLTKALQMGGLSKLIDKATLSGDHDHTGEGTTTRSGTLNATISCIVTEVLPNGNLRVEGRRDITVNNENQYVILSGIIRPEDIAGDNSVQSYQVADARIEYSGDGDIDDQQQPSWFSRFMSTIRIL
ncbi:MAG: flagellar basal body L-ring protein FlgH [Magnetococcales bacterium]|nr:flagellar basal body L-ring protein FlgH [Magnetococcales bacterium]